MAQAATDEKKFYLGIGGKQEGPFSESEIWAKIKSGEIPDTTPAWYDGLADWQPVNQVAPFNQPPPTVTSKPAVPRIVPRKKKENSEEDANPTFVDGSEADPVFNKKEAIFSRRSILEAYGKHMVLGLILTLFVGAVYYVFVAGEDIIEQVQNATKPRKPVAAPDTREARVGKALSELLLNPQGATATLRQAWVENPQDEIGKKAFATLLDFYANRSPHEAGKLLMENKQPEEAAKYFLSEPPSYSEAAQAYGQAAEVTTDSAKKTAFYLDEIRLLLGPGNAKEQALEKLQAFEKRYPGVPHSFRYYLKTPNQKIQDIFERISFYFVQSLLGYLDTEFKQIKMVTRPKIEVRQEKDRYRVTGSYTGEIILNRDRLSNIKLIFWLVKENWVLVETNLTEQREKWAKGEKQKHQAANLSADEMLTYLETIFRTQFPKIALHERPSQTKATVTE